MKREFWKVYDDRGAWVAACRDERGARRLLSVYPGSFLLKIVVDQDQWEAIARSVLS